ncbi:hypothetical protein [Candidatus Hodgkinia cicadicola]|uniref:hypothetical protein n=1 Tax=Candidatus Hodgkinia cicadicola TaxID=573658 RepID=UPI001788DF5C
MFNKIKDDRILERVISKLTELYPNINNLTKDMILILLADLSQGVKISCPLLKFPLEPSLKHYNKRLSINFNDKGSIIRWCNQIYSSINQQMLVFYIY